MIRRMMMQSLRPGCTGIISAEPAARQNAEVCSSAQGCVGWLNSEAESLDTDSELPAPAFQVASELKYYDHHC